jgi:hypothetical protein
MFYSPKRLHSHLGYVSPDEYENTYSEASWMSTKSGEDNDDLGP